MDTIRTMTKEEYRKTWYWAFTFGHSGSPSNWISGQPVRLFGMYLGTWWKLAKPNYPWAKN